MVPLADKALLIEIDVPAAVLLEVNERLPVNDDAPVVVMAPPLVNVKLFRLDSVPRENVAALPPLLRVRLLVGPAAKLAFKAPTLLELTRLAVTVSPAVVSFDVNVKDEPLSEPAPDSVIA